MRTVQSASSSTNALARKFGSIELRLLVTSFVGVLFVINMMVVGSHEKLLHEHFPNEARQGRKLQALSTSYRVEPKLVWLMSFPNSGTSFTSRLVRDATKTDSASNYADETISGQEGLILPVYKDQPMGPFWIKPAESPEFTEPANYVLTKVSSLARIILPLIMLSRSSLTSHINPLLLLRRIAECAVHFVRPTSMVNRRTASGGDV